MRFKRRAGILFLCLFCIAAFLPGCAEDRIQESDVKAVLPGLIEASKPLNEIYFGYGFPPAAEAMPEGGYYYVDGAHFGLYSISEIKEATERVFTAEYCQMLYTAAFDGAATEEMVSPPRFFEGELGLMQSTSSTTYILPEREYDYSTMIIKKRARDRVTLQIDTRADGETQIVELILVRISNLLLDGTTETLWRLDSPTY